MKPTLWDRLHQEYRYSLILFGSSLTSIAGIFLAVHWKSPDVASRAGAISTIMGLVLILVRPDYGKMSYEDRFPNCNSDDPNQKPMEPQVEALTQWLFLNSDGQDKQNRAIVIAGFIGSFFWGFGDIIARKIIQ